MKGKKHEVLQVKQKRQTQTDKKVNTSICKKKFQKKTFLFGLFKVV